MIGARTLADTWTWELLAGPATIVEGPVWDGQGLFYTSIADSEIRRYDPATGEIVTVYRDTGAANGLALGRFGSLYACEGGGRAVVRYSTDGVKTVLADRFEGRRLNSPNDLVIDAAGRVWFTDPRYGDDHSDRELDHDSVYRLTLSQGGAGPYAIERLTFDTTRPNGLLLSWDERTLYVAQSDYDLTSVRQLRAYPVRDDGSLGSFTVLHDFGEARGIDGMCWDAAGNIVATCGWEVNGPGGRIAIFAADGTVLEEHLLPAGRPSNCAFGGADLDALYVTVLDGRLYRVPNTGRAGHLRPPATPPIRGVEGR
jgi:gluconolactonase